MKKENAPHHVHTVKINAHTEETILEQKRFVCEYGRARNRIKIQDSYS